MTKHTKGIIKDTTIEIREEIKKLTQKRAYQLAGNYLEIGENISEEEIAVEILKQVIKDLQN